MRFYMLMLLLFGMIMISSPSPARAADEEGVSVWGSKQPKETPTHYIPPQGHGRPGGGGGGGRPGRPDYDFNKPGRPGDHHPGRPGGGRPGRPDRDRDKPVGADAIDHQKLMYGAMPTDSLMYGVIPNPNADSKKSRSKRRPNRYHSSWGYDYDCYPYCKGTGLWYDDDDDEYDRRYVQPQEPEKPFESGGVFERFDDPRDRPAHDSGYPKNSGVQAGQESPAQFDMDQYQMMMKAWQ